ncbi:MAG: hypothetical protein R2729_22560 [Bryobacteraceae bacterium]
MKKLLGSLPVAVAAMAMVLPASAHDRGRHHKTRYSYRAPAAYGHRAPVYSYRAPAYSYRAPAYGYGSSAYVGYRTPAYAGYVPYAPPPLRREYRGYAPGPGYVWVNGYWNWGARAYSWVPGRWMVPPARHTRWVPGRWVGGPRGFSFSIGFWR